MNNNTGTDVPQDKSATPLGWYAWYPRDFATSMTVRSMTFTARAIYRECLDIQWEHGCLTSVERLLNIIGISVEQWAEFAPYVNELFPNGVNPKMDQLRDEAFQRQNQKRIAGEKSAQARRNQVQIEQPVNTKATDVEQTLNECSTKHKHKHKQISSNEDIKCDGKKSGFSPTDVVANAMTAGISDQAVLAAIEDFAKHRQEIKHPLTARAAKMIISKIAPLTPDVAVEAIGRSIASGWRDVFPESVQKQNKHLPKQQVIKGAINWFKDQEAKAQQQAQQQALPQSSIDVMATVASDLGNTND